MKMALIAVDVQNDFCPGGALPVPEGDKVVGPINTLIRSFESRGLPVCFTRDWHPPDHCSFKQFGGTWPVHCVAETEGAAFHKDLYLLETAVVISKATQKNTEAYSGFDGTGLAALLREKKVEHGVVVGLATDYCVKATVLDALEAGFAVTVIREGVRAVNVNPDDGEKALAEMEEKGARLRNLHDFLEELSADSG